MILVGLTGGIGAGKSTVAQLFAAKGAVVIDADAIVRDLQRAGTPVFDAIVAHFGAMVVTELGDLDRKALAAIVFADPVALAALNEIVHPAVRAEMGRQVLAAAEGGADVVIMDVPLIVESHGREGMDHVVTVEARDDTRIDRLIANRSMTRQEAESRIAAQASRSEREAISDFVIENDGGLAKLKSRVDEIWPTILQ